MSRNTGDRPHPREGGERGVTESRVQRAVAERAGYHHVKAGQHQLEHDQASAGGRAQQHEAAGDGNEADQDPAGSLVWSLVSS